MTSAKFDYFMGGLCGAVTGYVAQGLRPGPMGFNGGTLEVLAVCCLIGSTFAALKRIEAIVTGMGAMHNRLYHDEVAGVLMDVSQKPDPQLNVKTGKILDPRDAQSGVRDHQARAQAANTATDRWFAVALRWYRWRNRLLILGFCLLVAGRIATAYVG